MSTPIGAALSIFVRGNTMKGRTRAKEEAFIRGDGDRLQVLSKPCMAPSIQEKGRFCKLTHPERSRRMRGRANRDGSVAPHTPMRARERPGRLPRVIPYGRRPSGGPSPILPTRPSRPELGPQTLRVGGDANGEIGGYSFAFLRSSFNYEVRLHPRFVDMVMIVNAPPKGTPFGSEIFEKFAAKPSNLTDGSGHFLDIVSEHIMPVWLWRKLLK